MTRIVLLSDTHGYVDERILQLASAGDEIWHAGDFGEGDVARKLAAIRPLRGVFGNIDGPAIRSVYPEYSLFTVEKVNVLLIHIAGSFGSYAPGVRELLKLHKPNMVVCGHSHILKVAMDNRYDVLYMNPGAAGKHGFHKIRTMLRFSIEGDEIKNLEAIELGARGAIAQE
jgi:putative phosphoesterase